MKLEFILIITILALNTADGGPYPPPQQRAQAGLNFSASVQQAKDQMQYFLAGKKPIYDSIDKIEEFYVDVKEKDMSKLHPRRKLRKPCKVLPDPQPGLVNPKLVAPVHRYKPLRRDEKFYGIFAPPISYEMVPPTKVKANDMVGGSLPPMRRFYPGVGAAGPYPPVTRPVPNIAAVGPVKNRPAVGPAPNYPAAGPVPNPFAYPVIQKQTVYAPNPNPFFGYQGDYNADGDYFQKEPRGQIVEKRGKHRRRRKHSFLSTATAVPTSWKSHLNSEYSLRISSMSAALALKSDSASIASMSFSIKMESMRSHFSEKEASLRSKLSSKAATRTATRTTNGWRW